MSASTRDQRLALAAVLLLAAGVRLWAIDFGLPYSFHNDEVSIVRRALAFATGDLNPHSFHWPVFHLYVLFALYGTLYVAARLVGLLGSVEDYARLYFSDPTVFYLSGRLLSAALGTATVYLTYRIARRLDEPRAGIFAALCLAVTYFHVRDSQLATLDVPAAFWVSVCLAIAVEIQRAPEVRRGAYLAGGMAAALATATKYNDGIVFLALTAAHWLRRPRADHRLLVLAGGTAALTFLVTCPFTVLDWRSFARDFAFQQRHIAEGQWGLSRVAAWQYYLSSVVCITPRETTLRLLDPMLLLFLLGAIGTLFDTERDRAVLLLIVPLVYLAIVGRWGMAATRYLDAILPVLAVATGLWLARRRRVGLALFVLALCLSLRAVAISDLVLSRPDTRTIAKRWFEQEIPSGTKVALESYTPPLAPSAESLDRRTRELLAGELRHPTQGVERMRRFYEWQKAASAGVSYDLVWLNDTLLDAKEAEANRLPETNYDLERLRAIGVRYVVVSSYEYGRFTGEAGREVYPKIVEFYDRLSSETKLVREFRPAYWYPGPIIRVFSLEAVS